MNCITTNFQTSLSPNYCITFPKICWNQAKYCLLHSIINNLCSLILFHKSYVFQNQDTDRRPKVEKLRKPLCIFSPFRIQNMHLLSRNSWVIYLLLSEKFQDISSLKVFWFWICLEPLTIAYVNKTHDRPKFYYVCTHFDTST